MSTNKTNEELVAEIQKGINTEENKVQLYRQNKRLILKFAKKYMMNNDELEDFISEGYFAIVKACDYYDPVKGLMFSTVLGYFLNTFFLNYTLRGRLVHIPRGVRENITKYMGTKENLLTEKGKVSCTEIMERAWLTERNMKGVRSSIQLSAIESIDEPVMHQDGSITNRAETLPDDFDLEQRVIHNLAEEQAKETVWELVDEQLTKKQAETIRMRFGIGMSALQIAEVQGVEYQTVYASIKKSVEKLRMSEKLRNIYEDL